MRATIKDIAAKAGLSVSSVSTILNNKPSRISEATKKKVFAIAAEMNYRPNRIAVNLKNNRSFTIGLIVPDIRNGFYSSIAKGVEDQCRKKGWNVILCNAGDSAERTREYIEVLDSKSVDAIVLNPSPLGSLEDAKQIADRLIELDIPFVQHDYTAITPNSNAVVVDQKKGGYLATKHLLELGHRKIACIQGPQYLEGSTSRFEGYKSALKEYNVPLDESIMYIGDYRAETGYAAMEYLEGKDFSAIFSFNDYMAFTVYKYLREKGYSIPDDYSIVGCDDDTFSEIINPPLTTIHQPTYEIGRKAAEILIRVVDDKAEQPIIKVFEPTLVVRQSTKAYK